MVHKNEFEELISLYALGTLNEGELWELEEHLNTGCKVCRKLLKDTESVLSLLPYSLDDTQLSPEIRDQVWEKIESAEKVREQSYTLDLWARLQSIWLKLSGAVALALLVFLFISNLYLKTSLTRQQQELSRMREQVSSQSEMMEFIQAPNVMVIGFTAPQPNSKAHGKLFWNTKNNEALFCALNIPASNDGKTYQFWVVEDNGVVSMGIFKLDRRGTNMMKLKSMPEPDKVQKFVVTIEPEGGMPKPTGEIYLSGSL